MGTRFNSFYPSVWGDNPMLKCLLCTWSSVSCLYYQSSQVPFIKVSWCGQTPKETLGLLSKQLRQNVINQWARFANRFFQKIKPIVENQGSKQIPLNMSKGFPLIQLPVGMRLWKCRGADFVGARWSRGNLNLYWCSVSAPVNSSSLELPAEQLFLPYQYQQFRSLDLYGSQKKLSPKFNINFMRWCMQWRQGALPAHDQIPSLAEN